MALQIETEPIVNVGFSRFRFDWQGFQIPQITSKLWEI